MNLTVHIPEVMASKLSAHGGELERRTLEALAAEEYRADCLTKPDLCDALGFEVLDECDAFLKAHEVYETYTLADIEQDRQTLENTQNPPRNSAP